MSSRDQLELLAAAVNVDPVSYPNDSKLEQAVLYAASNLTAGKQTVRTPTGKAVQNANSGKKNV